MSNCNRVKPRGGPQIGICNGVQKNLERIGSTPQGHTCPECWQLWPIVGGGGNAAAEEDWRWDLNPGEAAIWVSCWDHESCWDQGAWARVRTMWPWKCSLLPRGWCWEPESWTSTSFLRHDTQTGQREKEGLCAFVDIVKDFSLYNF